MSLRETVSGLWHNHALLMLLCCLVPILLLAAALYLGVDNSFLYFAALLLCPIMHFFLMKDLHKGGGEGKVGGAEKKCH